MLAVVPLNDCDFMLPLFVISELDILVRFAVYELTVDADTLLAVILLATFASPLVVTANAFFLSFSSVPFPTVNMVSSTTDWLYFPTAVS